MQLFFFLKYCYVLGYIYIYIIFIQIEILFGSLT